MRVSTTGGRATSGKQFEANMSTCDARAKGKVICLEISCHYAQSKNCGCTSSPEDHFVGQTRMSLVCAHLFLC